MYEQNNRVPASNALSLPGRHANNSATIPSAAQLPQNIFSPPPQFQPSSVINLANSTDVVIGPMTQYQGPVTIYQYMDATVEARATHANGAIQQNRTTQATSLLQRASTNSAVLILLVLIIVGAIGATIYLTVLKPTPDDSKVKKPILFGNEYETGTFPNLGNGHLVIDREQWGASDRATPSIPLEHPIPYVLITHVGVQATPCDNVYKCSIKMRTWQDSAIAEKNLPDINSNFYVGNDGNIYVGRGWSIANTYANKTLAVTFMGDYIRHKPVEKQLEAVQHLLAFGIANKYIATDYKLVAQNQTKTTRSPGAYVIAEIMKWPHWSPCGTRDFERCGVEIGLPEVWDAKQ